MIDNLKKIYPSLIVYQEENQGLDQRYNWFRTEAGEIIGIEKGELCPKDLSVLAAFMAPYRSDAPVLTPDEQKWRNAIDSDGADPLETAGAYRFVYFSIKENQISPELFKDALAELFPGNVPILWENGHEGILIEQESVGSDSISYEDIINILMSDLYIKIHFLVGPFRTGMEQVSRYHAFMLTAAKAIFAESNKAVANLSDAVPYLLIDQANADHHRSIREMILQNYADDEETLRMIEVFTKYNLNVSETAKALHLHRNSLQYRLDRFAENTGIDIRKFHQAMAVYLALLVKPAR
ncbi:regulator of polyketide synthase expression [Planococcus glaciei]|uniref:Regulator of polyketide synthase expression n=1 Tax=Planococcus glaciei TaxID=459472 RepID=A0A7H8QBT4_9BACL|nr:helix-turn-helix domain-containing protein [Planococcus glaciei]QDY45779.1 regulator of polyketide synthase expression [Planococcus glaciei]QKX51022.1 regulator of polyketide synthase expression [Planococcus glaciei]